MLRLVEPTKENLKEIKKGLIEIKNHPSPYDIHLFKSLLKSIEEDFNSYLEKWHQKQSEQQPEGQVPATALFLFDDDNFIGFFDIRHYLNEKLRKTSGHIGYEIIPSERNKGYGRKGLKLALKWCHDNLSLDKVLISCNIENHASYKVITSILKEVGGYEESSIRLNDTIKYRTWIRTAREK